MNRLSRTAVIRCRHDNRSLACCQSRASGKKKKEKRKERSESINLGERFAESQGRRKEADERQVDRTEPKQTTSDDSFTRLFFFVYLLDDHDDEQRTLMLLSRWKKRFVLINAKVAKQGMTLP